MKIGLFSDIHGNIYAFEKVWKELQHESCDLYCFMGDICGYYYHQNEVIDVLKSLTNLICVSGNHDAAFLCGEDIMRNGAAQESLGSFKRLNENIKPDNLNFLKNLPQKYSIEEFKLAVFHGSPWDYRDEYIYPTDSLVRFKDLPYEFIFLGHTHYAMDSSINHVRVINPGSCGQPRDLHQPSYATVDLKNRKVEIKRVQYNPKLLIKDIMKYDKDEPYLVRVLKR